MLRLNVILDPPNVFECYERICKEIPGILMETSYLMCAQNHFKCSFNRNVSNNSSPANNNSNNTLSQMLDDIEDGLFDIGLPYVDASEDRIDTIDFSFPLFNVPIVLVMRKPAVEGLSFRKVMALDWKVWICLILASIIVSVIATASAATRCHVKLFVLCLRRWVDSVSFLFNQARGSSFLALNVRILMIFWGFTALIVSSVYSGSLLASMLESRAVHPFEDFESFVDCIEHEQCKLASRSMSNTYIKNLYNSNISDVHFQRLRDSLLYQNQQLVVPNVPELLKSLLSTEDKRYVVWMTNEYSFLYFTNGNRNCSFFSLRLPNTHNARFPMSKKLSRENKEKVNNFAQDFFDSGLNVKVYRKYVNFDDKCQENQVVQQGVPLPIPPLYTSLFALGIGSVVGLAVFAYENVYTTIIKKFK